MRASSSAVAGHYLLVAAGTQNVAPGCFFSELHVLDIAQPRQPVEVAVNAPPKFDGPRVPGPSIGQGGATGGVSGGHVWLLSTGQGWRGDYSWLAAFDVSTGQAQCSQAQLPHAEGLVVDQSLAYVTT